MQARYDLAVEAIKTFHTGVSEDFLLKQDQFKELRDRLLKSAADFYGKLGGAAGPGDRPRLAAGAGGVELRAGRADRQGRPQGGRAGGAPGGAGGAGGAGGRAGGRRRGDGRRRPEPDRGRRAARSDGQDGRGAGDVPPGGVAAGGPGGVRPGGAGRAGGLPVAAGLAPVRRRARPTRRWRPTGWRGPTRRRWPRPPGPSNDARRDLADTVNRIGILLAETGKPTEAEAEYRQALAIHQKLADDNPAVTDFRSRPGGQPQQPRHPAERDGQAGGGGGRVPRRRWRSSRSWPTTTPPSPTSAASLADSHNNLGLLLSQTGKPAEAEAEYREALAIQREAGRRQPRRHRLPQPPGAQPQQPRHPAVGDGPAGGGGGRVPRGAGDLPPISRGKSQPSRYRDNVANLESNLSVVLRRLGRPAEARDLARLAVAALEGWSRRSRQAVVPLRPGR